MTEGKGKMENRPTFSMNRILFQSPMPRRMPNRWPAPLVVVFFLASCAGSPDRAPTSPAVSAPNAAFLAQSMEERWTAAVDARLGVGFGWGYLAALREGGQTRHFARGKRALEPVREVASKDSFEIGSVSKLFTGILLHLAAEDRKLVLTDRLSKFFPELAGKPSGEITLQELGQHRSGLPSAPPTLTEHVFENPWTDWTQEQAIRPLLDVALPAAPPAGTLRPREYSNWGFMILGLVLEQAYSQGYERILRQKILTPLRMTESGIDRVGRVKRRKRPAGSKSELMPSYSLSSEPSLFWDFTGFVAATGGIESTAVDMGKFLEAIDSALTPESRSRSTAPARLGAAIRASRETGVGWDSQTGEPFAWKNGATAAFSSILAWDEERRRGVFIVGNSHVYVDSLAWVTLGRNVVDHEAAPALAAPSPKEKDLEVVRGLYRVTDPAPRPVGNWDYSLRTVEIFESFGHARVRLDIGAAEKDSALLLATSDEDEWLLLDNTGLTHSLKVSNGGAKLVVRELDGTKTKFTLEKVERPLEKYPALE